MTGIDHCLPPIQAQRSKAFDKKSRSTTSWPILACSFVSSASRFCSRALPFSSKTWASFSTASRFQAAIWVGCKPCLVASSATVAWPLSASSATFALNSAENRLRVLMMDRPLHRRIHLSRLSQEVGPLLCCLARQYADHFVSTARGIPRVSRKWSVEDHIPYFEFSHFAFSKAELEASQFTLGF